MSKKPSFRLSPVAKATGFVTALLAGLGTAHAGIGFVDSLDLVGNPIRLQTYYAHSPSGAHGTVVPEAANVGLDGTVPTFTGKALRKFVDPLPKVGVPQTLADGVTSKYIPVAVPQKWVNPKGVTTTDDYYEFACIEYTEKFHTDLRKATTLRGYVQLSTAAVPGKALNLYYPNSSGKVAVPAGTAMPADAKPIMVQATDANNKLMFDAAGKPVMKQAQAVDDPHYLGPAVVAARHAPTRVKFHNLLPVGRAQLQLDAQGNPMRDASGNVIVAKRNGDLFIPVDGSLVGAGFGPDGMTKYTQNRIAIHNHGGDTPWISDGTALQWFTPAGEADPTIPGSLASEVTDPDMLHNFLRGASAKNVPDMNDAGAGAYTFYYPNGNSARLQWYHDHAAGITRLNAYAGMAAPYVITDSTEQDLVTRGIIPGAADTIYLVLQDKGFIPDDVAVQDQRWNTTAWGAPGDFYFVHVYETVQDPAQLNSWNPVGRWHYGPWFWPVFPALYPLPSGAYGDETTTPENWLDTPVINGVAYPVLDVEPKAYRFRILNGSNDRGFTFNLFKADTTKPSPWSVSTDPAWDGVTTTPSYGEPVMVPAVVPTNPCPAGERRSQMIDSTGAPAATYCTPETWAFDGRNGGVPAPGSQGPTLYQIGNEAGFLANMAVHEPAPTVPLYDVGRITVNNLSTYGLYLGNAERADVVVDFAGYEGQTLIAYNDMFAATPAGDPRNDYFTGIGDQSQDGGQEDTKLGYGPNIRTMMQIRVAPTVTTPGITFDPVALGNAIPAAYGASQERPIVAQSVYNQAFGTAWTDNQAYGTIFTGSMKTPTFEFVSGGTSTFNGVTVTNGGTGYTSAPTVTISGGNSTKAATAVATLKLEQVTVTNPGAGYLLAPIVQIGAQNGFLGAGATATASLKVATVTVGNGGSGYTNAPAVTFSLPQLAGGVRATGVATVAGGVVTGVTITNPGSGYVVSPTVSIAAPTAGTRATATTTGGVAAITLTAPDPMVPSSAGGGGYNDLVNGLVISFTPPTGPLAVMPTATATGRVYDVTLVDAGNYTGAVTGVNFTFTGGGGTGAQAVATQGAKYLVKTKAIHELFDPTYGRLNSILAMEVPFTSAMTQTTIPLNFIDPPTEIIEAGETQIWKVTHNGVDTHPVHFHLMDVQIVNRVGWDGFVSPPEPNEVGWKETVRMNPLEDIIIAVRPKKHALPPGVGAPNSIRPLDETQPLGSPFGFTQTDPNSGLPAVVVNTIQNFGWEYTWHCHILGHEENDFMRPIVFNAKEAVPTGPGNFQVVVPLHSFGQPYPGVTLNWTDTSSTEYKFQVLRGVGATGALVPYADVPANMDTFLDTNVVSQTTYRYQVVAVGGNGEAATAIVTANTPMLPPTAPANVTAVQSATNSTVTVSWVDVSPNETGFIAQMSNDGGVTWTAVSAAAVTVTRNAANSAATGGTVSFTTAALTPDRYYQFRVASVGAGGSSNWTTMAAPGLLVVGAPTAPANFAAAAATPTSVNLSWTDSSMSEVAWVVQRATVAANGTVGAYAAVTGGTVTSTTVLATGATVTLTDPTAVNGTTYRYRVQAVNTRGTSAWVTTANVPVMFAPAAPASVSATLVAGSTNQVLVSWVDGSTDETSFVVTGTYTTPAGVTSTVNVGTVTIAATNPNKGTTGATVGLPAAYNAMGGTWVFNVTAVGAGGTSAAVSSAPMTVVAPPVMAPAAVTATVTSATRVTVGWTDTSTNETVFRVQRATVTNGVVGAFAQVGTVNRTGGATTGSNTAVTFNDNTVAFGNTYVYQVQAESANAVSGYVQAAAPAVLVVGAPTAVTVVSASATSARLTWVDGGPLETRYQIQRSTNGGTTWTQLTNTAANATTYTATGLSAGTVYTFRITAQRVAGGATYSATPVIVNFTMVAPTPPAAPLNVVVTPARTEATVTWTDNSTNETSFIIEGCRGATCTTWANYGTFTSTTSVATGATLSLIDTGLRTATTYRYRVVPMNGNTRGTPSAIVNVTTLP